MLRLHVGGSNRGTIAQKGTLVLAGVPLLCWCWDYPFHRGMGAREKTEKRTWSNPLIITRAKTRPARCRASTVRHHRIVRRSGAVSHHQLRRGKHQRRTGPFAGGIVRPHSMHVRRHHARTAACGQAQTGGDRPVSQEAGDHGVPARQPHAVESRAEGQTPVSAGGAPDDCRGCSSIRRRSRYRRI